MYHIKPQNISLTLTTPSERFLHPPLLRKQTREYKLPGPAELCVLLDQKPTLAELAMEEPAGPPPQSQHICCTKQRMGKKCSVQFLFFKQPKLNLAQYYIYCVLIYLSGILRKFSNYNQYNDYNLHTKIMHSNQKGKDY